jgi:single-strand DNA-binding protein
MNDSITIRGIVATDPRHLVTGNGLAITSMRLASPSRRWDRTTSSWVNGDTNWFTVTAFRSLASNLHKSITKGDRVIVTGRLRVRHWERDERSGMSVEIDADAVGHDLAYGRGTWIRVPRHTTDETAPPGETPRPREADSLESDQGGGGGDGDGAASIAGPLHDFGGIRADAQGVVADEDEDEDDDDDAAEDEPFRTTPS